jgi:hypothetical protein
MALNMHIKQLYDMWAAQKAQFWQVWCEQKWYEDQHIQAMQDEDQEAQNMLGQPFQRLCPECHRRQVKDYRQRVVQQLLPRQWREDVLDPLRDLLLTWWELLRSPLVPERHRVSTLQEGHDNVAQGLMLGSAVLLSHILWL